MQTRKKRKRKIRWKGVAILAFIAVAFVAALFFLVSWVISLFGGGSASSEQGGGKERDSIYYEKPLTDATSVQHDQQLAERIDSLIKKTTQLDDTQTYLYLFDATTHRMVTSVRGDELVIPASCIKLPVAIMALQTLGLDYHYKTQLYYSGEVKDGVLEGTLLLHTMDNPVVESLQDLADSLKAQGITTVRGQLAVNMMREDRLNSHPSSKSWDIRAAQIPLLIRGKQDLENTFRYTLATRGIKFVQDEKVVAPSLPDFRSDKIEETWRLVASMDIPLTDVTTPMLNHSSNVKAECLFYHLDYLNGLIPDRQMHWKEPHAVEQWWRKEFTKVIENEQYGDGTDYGRLMSGIVMKDGSGLSPENLFTAHLLVEVLRYAWQKESIRQYLLEEALAMPGTPRCGSLTNRMPQPYFHDRVFVKTGTLVTKGVSSLAGYVHGKDDHWYIFSIINANAPVAESHIFQDNFCKVLCK